MNLKNIMAAGIGAVFCISSASAGEEAFHAGTILPDFGKVATIASDMPIPDGTVFKVSFDISEPADAGKLNRRIATVARFLNMHAEVGIPVENMKLAVVIHGGATKEFTTNKFYHQAFEADNANLALIEGLISKGVKIYICGQSAAYHNVSKEDLAPGVEMALSAMTAHALLQQQGYSLNPF